MRQFLIDFFFNLTGRRPDRQQVCRSLLWLLWFFGLHRFLRISGSNETQENQAHEHNPSPHFVPPLIQLDNLATAPDKITRHRQEYKNLDSGSILSKKEERSQLKGIIFSLKKPMHFEEYFSGESKIFCQKVDDLQKKKLCSTGKNR
jgi:hypothetical protein